MSLVKCKMDPNSPAETSDSPPPGQRAARTSVARTLRVPGIPGIPKPHFTSRASTRWPRHPDPAAPLAGGLRLGIPRKASGCKEAVAESSCGALILPRTPHMAGSGNVLFLLPGNCCGRKKALSQLYRCYSQHSGCFLTACLCVLCNRSCTATSGWCRSSFL